jgi:peptidoglycan/xylan/chitin deacetylase (PgdA/CDA1 family)
MELYTEPVADDLEGMGMKRVAASVICLLSAAVLWSAEPPRTEITKWQDGKQACVSITYDDSSINQFRIAVPLMNERHLPGTFFVITGGIQGSKNQPTFVGRPIMNIIRESESIPTTSENLLERISMLNYLQTIEQAPELKGFSAQRLARFIQQGNVAEVAKVIDPLLATLRQTGATYAAGPRKSSAVAKRNAVTWDELRQHAAEGHEMANHTISHPFMPAMDEANIVYELEKANADILEQMGPKHTFTAEIPYGIDDKRVSQIIASRFPLARNWVTDDFMEGFMRSNWRDPTQSKKEYVQWQRGMASRTTREMIKGWIDTSNEHGIWLVLVIHGVEGIGYEPVTTETLRNCFDDIADHQRTLWAATYQDGAKYARERVNSTVKANLSGDAIEMTVTHSLDKTLYDLPLTARTAIPADWKLVRFKQGNDVRWLPIHRVGDSSYVMYRIAPDGTVATLEKGLN